MYSKKDNSFTSQVLILTASENVEKLEALVEALPQFHFHIAAQTQMGQKLTRLDRFENVTLYPVMDIPTYQHLLETCSIYLDINHHREILEGTQAALNQGAFEETCHHLNLLSPQHLWKSASVSDRVAFLETFTQQPQLFQKQLIQQLEKLEKESKFIFTKIPTHQKLACFRGLGILEKKYAHPPLCFSWLLGC